jgi:hypothetical protein
VSIRILDREDVDDGEREIALVETVNADTNEESVSWQFTCELCGEFRTNVTEAEARDALANHSCKVLQEFGEGSPRS